jgi:trk system potassium uptake protein TrkA
MKVLIVGGGETLYFLCRSFTAKGYEVVIINRNQEECVQLAQQLSATVVWGDGSDAGILKEGGAMGADAVLAITPNDQDNLVICQLASLQFGVPRAVALANDPDNAEVFETLGVSAFSTTHIVGSLIEQRASLEQITNLLPVGEGRVNVTEITLDADSPVAGKLLKDIDLPENALVAVVIRENQPIVPRGATRLMAGDRLVLITLPENHGPVLRAFTGEQK